MENMKSYSRFEVRKDEYEKFQENSKKNYTKAAAVIRKAIFLAINDDALFEEVDKVETIPVKFAMVEPSNVLNIYVCIDKQTLKAFHAVAFEHKETVVCWVRKFIRYMNRLYEAKEARQASEKERVERVLWKL